jgi:hypothetical protein
MTQRIDLTGQVFGRLTVINYIGSTRWKCVCSCGKEVTPLGQELRKGKVQSCGCYRKEVTGAKRRTHSASRSRTYRIWAGMKARCNIKSASGYKNWGGRGIKVCERWLTYENFLKDMGECPDGYAINRIDHNGDYEPNNCEWVTQEANNRIQRKTIFIEGKTVREWAQELGVHPTTVAWRLRKFGSVHGK